MAAYIQEIRRRFGKRKIPIIYASLCILDAAGRLLWQRRGDSGVWGLPGGVLELDETLKECALREALEETGLEVEITRLLGIYSSPDFDSAYPNGDQIQQVTYCYTARAITGKLHVDHEETLELAWIPATTPVSGATSAAPPTFPWYRVMHADLLADSQQPAFRHGIAGGGGAAYLEALLPLLDGYPFITPAAQALLPNGRTADGLMQLGERLDATAARAALTQTGLAARPTGLAGIRDDPREQETLPGGGVIRRVTALFQCEW